MSKCIEMNKYKNIKRKRISIITLLLSTVVFGFFLPMVNVSPINNSSVNYIEASWAPPPEARDNYAAALQKAIYFYLQQRTGDLPDNNPVIWRDDSALNDGADVGLDLAGGYLDAGDHVKFGLPMASTVFTIALGIYEYKSGFQKSGQLEEAIDAIKWGTDYFIKAHPTPNEFYFQVGDGGADHAWWGSIEVIENVMSRPSYKVTASQGGSAVAGATAAALTLTSIILEDSEPAYAATCLNHAIDLYNLARAAQSDDYYNSIAGGFYQSWSGFWDEIAATATLLYMKTGNSQYLTEAEEAAQNWNLQGQEPYWEYQWGHAWDDMHYIAQILLARITGKQEYIDSVERNLDWWMPSGGITYSPGGLAWLDSWGALRYAANTAFLAFMWVDSPYVTSSKVSSYLNFAETQINYALGDNPNSRSYICGFGTNPPVNPHHRTAHGSWANSISTPAETRHILYGALVGGPDASDNYQDVRSDYVMNEVACDYNSGLVSALAKMTDLYGGSPHDNFPGPAWFTPEDERIPEMYADARLNSDGAVITEISVDLTNHAAWPARDGKNLKYRYYFDIRECIAAGYSETDVNVQLTQSEVPATAIGPIHVQDNIYYAEVDYSGSNIFPGGQSESARETQLRISLPSGAPDSAWDPTNDWSYQGLSTSGRIASEFIPVFDNGELVFGTGPIVDLDPPSPPTGLTANAISPSEINLDWNDNTEPDLSKYYIHRGISSGFTPELSNRIAEIVISEYSDDGLQQLTTYYYKVIAVDTSNNPSAPSNVASDTTLQDTTPPAAPTGLQATAMTYSQIDLDWNDNSDSDFAKYVIYRGTSPGVNPILANKVIETPISQYSDTGLNDLTIYYYIVTAVDINDNESPTSNEDYATTPEQDLIAPAAPTGLVAESAGTTRIQLNWNDNIEPDLAKYNVYRGNSPGFTPDDNTNKITETTLSEFLDTGLQPETTYYYVIKAVDTSNNISPASNEDNAITDNVITQLRAQYLNGNTASPTQTVRANIDLYNDGGMDVALSDVTIRYWFTSEAPIDRVNYVCYYAHVGADNIISSFGDAGSTQYLEIGFTTSAIVPNSGTNVLRVGDNTREIQNAFHDSSYQVEFDQTNDHSYDSSASAYQDNTKITVYYQGELVWGTEPGVTNPTPTISHPSDISYQEGQTGNSISWTATDDNPTTYTITQNGAQIASGSWSSGSSISINVDGLSAGTYTYTCTVFDGNSQTVSDSVTLTVTEISVIGGDVWFSTVTTQQVGDVFTTEIYVDTGSQNLGAYGLVIDWDQSILIVQGGNDGVAAGADGFLAAANVDNNVGTMMVSGFEATGAGPNSQLHLLTITWEAVGAGTTPLDLTIETLVDSDTNIVGNPTDIDGSVLVAQYQTGDVNHDGSVDIIDALMISQYDVGLDPQPFFIEQADVNEDGLINIIDALLVAQYSVGLIDTLPP